MADWNVEQQNFTLAIESGGETIVVHVDIVQLVNQFWIWMGTEPKMGNLHSAIETFAGVTSTKLIGDADDTVGGVMACRLAKKLGGQIFLSSHLPSLTQLAEAQLQQKLIAELLNRLPTL